MGTGQESTSGGKADGQKNQVLSFRRKFVYATGTIGDSLPYNATSFYLFFYLTTVVNMSPLDAGILVGLPAFFLFPLDSIAGVLSDRVRSRFGRRHTTAEGRNSSGNLFGSKLSAVANDTPASLVSADLSEDSRS